MMSAEYASLLIGTWDGPVVTWKDEGRSGPVHHYPSAGVFRETFGRPRPFDPDHHPLWLSRGQASKYAKAHKARLVIV